MDDKLCQYCEASLLADAQFCSTCGSPTRGPSFTYAPVSAPSPQPDAPPPVPPTPPRRRSLRLIWTIVVVGLVAIACAVALVVRFGGAAGNIAIHHAPTSPDMRVAPEWGPAVDLTQDLPDVESDSHRLYMHFVSGDLYLAWIDRVDSELNVVDSYLVAVNSLTSQGVWTITSSKDFRHAGTLRSVAVNSATGWASAVVCSDATKHCSLATIDLATGRVLQESVNSQFDGKAYPFIEVAIAGDYIIVTTAESGSTRQFGYSDDDLDNPLWQRPNPNAHGAVSIVAKQWACAAGCWALKDGSAAPFGADARLPQVLSGTTWVQYIDIPDSEGQSRVYRYEYDGNQVTWQQWSPADDQPFPGSAPLTFDRLPMLSLPLVNNSHFGGSTMLLCSGDQCTPWSLDGSRSYPSFGASEINTLVESAGTLLVLGHANGPSVKVTLETGATEALPEYDWCVVPNDIAYCYIRSPLLIEAVDPAGTADAIWSYIEEAEGALFGVTDSTMFLADWGNRTVRFAPRV